MNIGKKLLSKKKIFNNSNILNIEIYKDFYILSNRSEVKFIKIKNYKENKSFVPNIGEIETLSIINNLLILSSQNIIYSFDLENNLKKNTILKLEDEINIFSLYYFNNLLYIGCVKYIYTYNLLNKTFINKINTDCCYIHTLIIENNLLYVGSYFGKTIEIYDINDLKLKKIIFIENEIYKLKFFKNYLIVLSTYGNIFYYNIKDYKQKYINIDNFNNLNSFLIIKDKFICCINEYLKVYSLSIFKELGYKNNKDLWLELIKIYDNLKQNINIKDVNNNDVKENNKNFDKDEIYINKLNSLEGDISSIKAINKELLFDNKNNLSKINKLETQNKLLNDEIIFFKKKLNFKNIVKSTEFKEFLKNEVKKQIDTNNIIYNKNIDNINKKFDNFKDSQNIYSNKNTESIKDIKNKIENIHKLIINNKNNFKNDLSNLLIKYNYIKENLPKFQIYENNFSKNKSDLKEFKKEIDILKLDIEKISDKIFTHTGLLSKCDSEFLNLFSDIGGLKILNEKNILKNTSLYIKIEKKLDQEILSLKNQVVNNDFDIMKEKINHLDKKLTKIEKNSVDFKVIDKNKQITIDESNNTLDYNKDKSKTKLSENILTNDKICSKNLIELFENLKEKTDNEVLILKKEIKNIKEKLQKNKYEDFMEIHSIDSIK